MGGIEDGRLDQDDPPGGDSFAALDELRHELAEGRLVPRLLLEIDEEDAPVSELGEQLGLCFARWLATEDASTDVAKEAVLLGNVGEVEVAIEGAGRRLGDQEEVDRLRLELLGCTLSPGPDLLALLV